MSSTYMSNKYKEYRGDTDFKNFLKSVDKDAWIEIVKSAIKKPQPILPVLAEAIDYLQESAAVRKSSGGGYVDEVDDRLVAQRNENAALQLLQQKMEKLYPKESPKTVTTSLWSPRRSSSRSSSRSPRRSSSRSSRRSFSHSPRR